MKLQSQRYAMVLMFTFLVLMISGCSTPYTTLGGASTTSVRSTIAPAQAIVESPNPAFMNAQATIDTGKSQLLDLSRKETETSLNLAQAADAAALSTKDFNQRQKADLNFQATVVSLNITQAAATQRFVLQQTKMARDATTAAQSSKATAAQFIYLVNVNQTKQVQAILNAQATQTAQAIAALTSYPSTATSVAVTQAALLGQQYGREQQTFVKQIVVPLIPILITLDLIAFILVVILAYRRSITIPWPRRLQLAPGIVSPDPIRMIDGVISDVNPSLHPPFPAELPPDNPPRRQDEATVHVEIVSATEPPVAQWIAEVEHQMTVEGGV